MSTNTQKKHAGLPDPATVVEERTFTPPPSQQPGPGGGRTLPKTYKILKTTQTDADDSPAAAPTTVSTANAFTGTSRKAAKMSIGTGQVEVMQDLKALIASLPPDQDMVHHNPPITDKATSGRAVEENRNVHLHAFIYAASREADNDFHLIIGSDPNGGQLVCMTMELSGLPTKSSANFNQYKKPRDDYKAFFADNLPGTRYDFYSPPIPVRITGSIFFDIHHATGSHPGPASLRPNIPTIWEVHPITEIVFEP